MLTSIDDIPQAWRDLLRDIRQVCPSAVLAGGALRDLDNDRPVKDLDIFIHADGEREAFTQADMLRGEMGLDVTLCGEEGEVYPEDQNLEVIRIADVEHDNDDWPPVQLIFTSWDTARIVERFDYGICRLSFDGEKIVRPTEYEEDKVAQVFRLRRDRPTPMAMRGSVHRFARLTADKYVGWTWWPFEPEGFFSTADAYL